MSDTAQRWDARWRRRGGKRGQPTPLIQEWCRTLPAGAQVLELGAGNGRDSLPLARQGLRLTAVDASAVGLAAVQRTARSEGLLVETLQVDLGTSLPPALLQPHHWHAIISANVLLEGVHAQLRPALRPGGLVVFVQPGSRNLERHARPSGRFLAAPGHAEALASGLEILHHREDWSEDGRFLVELVARAPAV